jgi:group I intron endonuclease
MRRRARSGVYEIINEINGKFYVGSSIDIDNRWAAHRNSFKKPKPPTESLLFYAVQKYGIENFTFIVLEECEPIKETLLEREQHYLDTLKPAYNIMPTAGSRLGSKQSPETIAKVIASNQHHYEARRGKTLEEIYGEETAAIARAKITEAAKAYGTTRQGKTFIEIFGEELAQEIATKMSENRTGKHVGFDPWNKGVPMSDEQRALLSEIRIALYANGLEHWNEGNTMSDEMRAKLEAGGFWEMTDEKRRHLSESHLGQTPWNLGIPATDEQRQRASEIAKANFDPEHQAHIAELAREANTGKHRSEATKQKISQSNLTSEARKAFAESRRGIARTEKAKQHMSDALQNSEAAAAYHAGRVGKRRGNGSSGHAGVSWDKNREKWLVRFKGKTYGRYENLDDAAARAEEVIASLT